MPQCYECKNQYKGYCKKSLELYGEKMQISGHDACNQHYTPFKGKVRIKVPSKALSLISGVKVIYRDESGSVTVVYTDNKSNTRFFNKTLNEFNDTEILPILREIQEIEEVLG